MKQHVGGLQCRNALQAPIAASENNFSFEDAVIVVVIYHDRASFVCRWRILPASAVRLPTEPVHFQIQNLIIFI